MLDKNNKGRKHNKTINEINQEKLNNKKTILEKMKKVKIDEIETVQEDSKDVIKINKQMQKQKEQFESKIHKLEQALIKQNKESGSLTDQLKEINRKQQLKIEDLNNELSTSKKSNELKIAEIMKNHENEIDHFRVEQDIYNEKINSLNTAIDEKKNELEIAKEEINLLSKNNIANTVSELRSELKQVTGKSKTHLHNYETQCEINKKLKQEFGELKSEFNDKVRAEKIRLNSREIELNEEVQRARKERYNFNLKINNKRMLFALNRDLTEDNVFEYGNGLRQLNKKFEEVIEEMRKKQDIEREKQRLIKKEESRNWVIDNSDVGYIGVDSEDNWYFYTIDNQIYSVTSSKVPELISDIPARAIVDKENNSAHVVYCFYDTQDFEDDIQQIEKKLIKIRPKKYEDEGDFLYFGNLTVLIVGSQNKQKYVWRGQKHGLTIIWHDPFEEHESRLKDKLQQCDIAIICLRHIPHTVTDIIDKSDPKIQLMEQDTEERVMARIRYAAIKLGLITFNRNLQ